MIAFVTSNIELTNPTPEAINWCNKNLTLINPDYAKKARMGLWLGNTPKTLSLYELRGNKLILPFGVLRDLPNEIKENTPFFSNFKEHEEINYGGDDVPLYDYQQEAVENMYKGLYGILQSPPGTGKTQIGIALAKKYKTKTLWLTHTIDLLNQSKKRAEMYMDKSLIGTITDGKVNVGKGITFATIQTMCKLDLDSFKDEWGLIIVDECHRVAGTPTSVTQFSKVLNSLSAPHKYGLSATVHRADGMIKATYALLGKIIHTVPEDAILDKITRVGINPVMTNTELSRECLNTDGTLNYARLINYLCEDFQRTHFIAGYIIHESEHSCLVLSDRLKHLENMMNCLPDEMKEKAVMVSGKMTTKKEKAAREQAIEDMRTGKKKYLFATYSLAKEGLDIPCLDRLFLTTPQKDYAIITQSIGRIARKSENKTDAVVYDFVDHIGFTMKSYKKRCTTYRKNGCYFIE